MRIPVAPSLSTKDGLSNKNARLTNALKETTATSEFAVVRPGLALNAEATGVGRGLVVFNDELVSVYGTTLGVGAAGGTVTSVYTLSGGVFAIYGASFLGSDEWLLWGDNTVDAHVYTGDGNGIMSIDESGFDTSQVPGLVYPSAYTVANSGTTVILISNQIAQGSPLPTPLAFSEVDSCPNSGDSFIEIRYIGGYFVSTVDSGDDGERVHYSDDDGATWTTTDADSGVLEHATSCFDGTNWCFFSCVGGTALVYNNATTDFASFTHDALSLTPALLDDVIVACSSYSNGYFYISLIGGDWDIGYATYYSADGVNFAVMNVDMRITIETATGLLGVGGVSGAEIVYSIESGSATLLESGIAETYAVAANDDSTAIVLGDIDTSNDTYYRIGVTATIDPLATVDGPFFDFAQSPL